MPGVSHFVKLSLRDEGFPKGRTAILPFECKREFISRAASITGRSSRTKCETPVCNKKARDTSAVTGLIDTKGVHSFSIYLKAPSRHTFR